MKLASDLPGQKFLVDGVDGMVGDVGQYVAQIGLRIAIIESGATDEQLHGNSWLPPCVS